MEREYMRDDPQVAGKGRSLWIDTAPPTDYPPLQGTHETEVAVVGAGLTGVITAALLREAGLRVAVIEAGRVGCNATGHTTAKVTFQHGLVYRDLVENLGEYEALTYAESNLTGLNLIARLVHAYRLDCDFRHTPFRLFAETDAEARALRSEAEVTRGFGLPVELEGPSDDPFPMREVMRVDDQAQFHPLKFVVGLLGAMAGDSFTVFENTRALDIDDAPTCTVTCEHGEVRARKVVVATQFPFYDHGVFFSRLFPYADHAFALRLPARTAASMYHDTVDHGVRTFPAPGDPLVIVSGGRHRSGQADDERSVYRRLETWARQRYGDAPFEYHWSTEDYFSPDRMPYVGASPGSKRVCLATGFEGWGMTKAAASAILMSDLVLGKENPWAEVFDPLRLRPKASWRSLLHENANVAETFVLGRGGHAVRSVAEIRPGDGAVLSEGGRRYAAYRDFDGRLHLLDPTCTHLACEVRFNDAEKTWDCPCHGSRYSVEGAVLHGPAPRPLRAPKLSAPQ